MKTTATGILVAAAAAAAIAIAQTARLSSLTEPVTNVQEPLYAVTPSLDKPVRQTFTATGQTISGIVLYTKAPQPAAAAIRVLVRDHHGHILSRGRGSRTETKDDVTKIIIPTAWFTPAIEETITLEITSSAAMPLIATGDSEYAGGALLAPPQIAIKDLVLAVTYPSPLSNSTRQGVYIGLAAALAAYLMQTWGPLIKNQRWRWYLAGGVTIGTSLLVSIPLFFPLGTNGVGDWDYRFSLNHIYRSTILHDHQFPFWNPYMCGGAAALGDPEFSVLSPAFAAILAFGPAAGFKIALCGSFMILGIGMTVLAKRLGCSPTGAYLAALAGTFNGAVILKMVEGHVTIIFAYMWLPWVLWAYLGAYQNTVNASRRWRWIIGSAAGLSLMLYAGGIYVLSYTLPVLLAAPLFMANRRRAFTSTISVVGLFLALSAAQLLPTLAYLGAFPDQRYVASTTTVARLIDIFFIRHSHGSFILPQQLSGWHEYGAYLGYGVAALALLGIPGSRRRLRAALLTAALVSLVAASLGPTLAPAFDRMPFIPRSNVSRLVLITCAAVALLAGSGLTWAQKKNISPLLLTLVIGAVCVDLASYAYPELEKTFSIAAVPDPIPAPAYPLSHTRRALTVRSSGLDVERSYFLTKAGYGTFTFCTVIGPESQVIPDTAKARQPFIIQPRMAGKASVKNWTPNHFQLHAESDTPQEIVFNSNDAPGWQATVGRITDSHGRLAIDVPAGTTDATIFYRPPYAPLGAAITLVTLVGMIWHALTMRSPPGQIDKQGP